MGFWPYRTYVQYIEKHAQGRDKVELHYPYTEAFNADNPRILLSFYSMPLWMDTFDISFDDQDVTFRRRLFAYRSASKDHVDHIREQLKLIDGPLTGKALLKELRDTGQWLRILPNWYWLAPYLAAAAPDGSILGEPGGGGSADMDTWKAATAKGAPVPNSNRAPIRDASGNPVVGTGAGTNSVVWHNAGRLGPKHPTKVPGYQPDEVLYHELVHATRQMRGAMNEMPVNQGYDDLEEYLSVVLTNIYLSDKGQTKFQGNHGSRTILQGADADNFLHNSPNVDVTPTMLIQNFKDYQPDFYRALANLPPGRPQYNWVRQYDQEAQAFANQNRKPA